MTNNTQRYPTVIITILGILLILTWLRYAQELVVPFVLSLFITIIFAGPVDWLRKKGMPKYLAITSVLLIIIVFLSLVSMMLGSSIQQFTNNLPTYQHQIQQLVEHIVSWFAHYNIDISKTGILKAINTRTAMNFLNSLLVSLTGTFSNIFLIVFTVIFMLMDAWNLPMKIEHIYGNKNNNQIERLANVVTNIKKYMSIKTISSLISAVFITAGLMIVGLEFAMLWGILAFLLNFIPNIGSIIAAIPPILFALIQLGFAKTLIVAGIYLVVNMVIGNFLEPRYIGASVGLTLISVFLSLVFWAWVFGPIGMILAVPLTMMIKFGAEASDEFRWLSILLSPLPADEESVNPG